MNQMAVDIDQGGSVGLNVDDMVVPDLVIKGARLARGLNHVLHPCRGGRGLTGARADVIDIEFAGL